MSGRSGVDSSRPPSFIIRASACVLGGNALKYYSSVRLDVRRKESLRDNAGITVKVKVSAAEWGGGRRRGEGGPCFLRVARVRGGESRGNTWKGGGTSTEGVVDTVCGGSASAWCTQRGLHVW